MAGKTTQYAVHGGRYYDVAALWRLADRQTPRPVPVARFASDIRAGRRIDKRHAATTAQAELRFPIILAPDGTLLDGAHRLAKARDAGLATVPGVRLRTLPRGLTKDELLRPPARTGKR